MHRRADLKELFARAGLGSVPPRTIVVIAIVCALAVAFGVSRRTPSSDSDFSITTAADPGRDASRTATPSSDSSEVAQVAIHIVGAVRRPGLYTLESGARVAEAVSSAGGMLSSADQRGVNLARVVTDGEQIVVPTKDEVASGLGPPGVTSGTGSRSGVGPVDINSADAALLDTLPGVGPATATRIVADRDANGPFGSVDDLGRVSGIGPKKIETLKDLVVAR